MRQHSAPNDSRVAEGIRFRAWPPLRRAEQLGPVSGCRRGLFESRSEARCVRLARSSSAAALPGQAAQGHPVNTGRESRGGLPLVTFLGRARKVTSRRAAPGLLFAARAPSTRHCLPRHDRHGFQDWIIRSFATKYLRAYATNCPSVGWSSVSTPAIFGTIS